MKTTGRARRTSTKTRKPELEPQENTEETDVLKEAAAEKKPETEPKPKLHAAWPTTMVISILSFIAIPFIPSEEKILLISIASSLTILSVFVLLSHEKKLRQWYYDNPDFLKKKKSRKERTRVSMKKSNKTIRPALSKR